MHPKWLGEANATLLLRHAGVPMKFDEVFARCATVGVLSEGDSVGMYDDEW